MLPSNEYKSSLDRKRRYLRHTMRAERRAIAQSVRREADRAIYKQLLKHTRLKEAATVASYVPIDGEVDVFSPLCAMSKASDLKVFLPKVTPIATLEFYLYQKDVALIESPLCLKEPAPEEKNRLAPETLDLLIVPLVAFDFKGYRLGMGGGYYDRLLTDWSRHLKRHPQVVGVAYTFQAVEAIAASGEDVPLPMIVTPERAWRWPEHDLGYRRSG